MIKVIGRAGQTIFDLAIQHYGSVQGIDFIIIDNPSLEPHALLEDQEIIIRKEVINSPVKNHLQSTVLTTY